MIETFSTIGIEISEATSKTFVNISTVLTIVGVVWSAYDLVKTIKSLADDSLNENAKKLLEIHDSLVKQAHEARNFARENGLLDPLQLIINPRTFKCL